MTDLNRQSYQTKETPRSHMKANRKNFGHVNVHNSV